MDKMVSFDAILFPADERAPHLVPLMTSNASLSSLGPSGSQPPPSSMGKVPHPEMYMDFIAEGVGARAWRHHVCFSYHAFACFHPLPACPSIPDSSFSLLPIGTAPEVVRSGDHPPPSFLCALPNSPNANQTIPTRDRLSSRLIFVGY